MTNGYKLKSVGLARAARLLAGGKFSPYRTGGRLLLLPLSYTARVAYEVRQ